MGATTSRHRHFPPDGRLIGLALAIVATLYLTISTLTLLNWGFNYDEAGGNVFEKIHPATFIAAATLLLAGLMQGNPLTALIGALDRYPGHRAVCRDDRHLDRLFDQDRRPAVHGLF